MTNNNNNSTASSWHNFLKQNDNKTELFQFLVIRVAQMSAPNLVIITNGPAVLSIDEAGRQDLDKLIAASLCMPNML